VTRPKDPLLLCYTVYVICSILSAATLIYSIYGGAFLAIATLFGLSLILSNLSRNNPIIVFIAFLTAYTLLGALLSYYPLTNIESSGSGIGQQYKSYIWNGEYTYDGKLRMLKFLVIGFLLYMVGEISRAFGAKSRRDIRNG
jgi:hypothetical protein